MATITKRASGRWQAKVRRKGYPDQGKTFETKSAAEVWAREIERSMDRGVFQSTAEAEDTLFKDLVATFKTDFAPEHYRKRKDKREAWRFQCDRLEEFFGEYSIAAIDQKLIREYRDQRLSGIGDRKPVSNSTTRKEIYLLSKILGYAAKELDILLPRGNPVALVRKPKEPKSRDRRLTDQEWDAMIAQCRRSRNPWLYAAVQLSVEMANRQGELLNFRWQDLDLQRRIMLLTDPDLIKTGETRDVPLSSKAVEIFNSIPKSLSGMVFPVSRETIYSAYRAAVQRAGIKNFTWHDLRHEALSRLGSRSDLAPFEIASISGHKTMKTLQKYIHINAEQLAKKLG